MILGTGEPKLRALPPALLAAAQAIVGAVSAGRLRADVAALAEPRGRLHAPEAMERAEAYVRVALGQAGWVAERRSFELRDVAGNLDHDGYGPVIYPELSGVNIVAMKRG